MSRLGIPSPRGSQEYSCPYVAGGATAQRLGRETRVQEAAP
jgi:hypothetical protein